MTIHRERFVFSYPLLQIPVSPGSRIIIFLALVQLPCTEKEVILVVSLPSNYLVLSNRII